MKMGIQINLFVSFFLPLLANAEIKLSERMKPVLGETFFASKQLLESKMPQMDEFKAIFTLPKNGTHVQGNLLEIYEQLAGLSEIKAALFIRIRVIFKNIPTRQEVDPYLYAFAQNLTRINFSKVEELWIIADIRMRPFPYLPINIDDEYFPSLQYVHFIPNSYTEMILPLSFTRLVAKCKVLHFENVVIRLYKGQSVPLSTNECSESPEMCASFKFEIGRTSEYGIPCLPDSTEVLSIKETGIVSYWINTKEYKYNYPVYGNMRYFSITSESVVSNFLEGIPSSFPNLQVLEFSHNFDYIDNSNVQKYLDYYMKILMENMLFHQKLELFISVNELDISLSEAFIEYFTGSSSYDSLDMANQEFSHSPVNFAQCMLELNTSNFWNDLDSQCMMLKCVIPLDILNCSIKYISYDDDCYSNVVLPIAPQLEVIHLGNVLFRDVGLDLIFFATFEAITEPLKLLNVYDSSTPDNRSICFGPNSLRSIDMAFHKFMHILYDFSDKFVQRIQQSSTKGLWKMEEIILNNAEIDAQYIFNLFRSSPFPNLKHIHLRATKISLPRDLKLCKNLHNLTTIDLSQNKIKTISKNLFRNCFHLKMVNLSRNEIQAISTEVHKIIDGLDISIDLSNNPLSCECHKDALETLKWLHKHHYKYESFDKYMCYGFVNTKFISKLNIDDHYEKCQGWLLQDIILIASGSSFITLVTTILIGLSYKYRYRIIMKLFAIKRFCSCKENPNSRRIFAFELYVVYCNEDRQWVHDELLPVLEEKHGIRCCIHYRDFPANGTISKVIYKYMNNSRYTLVVMSQNSVNKRWPAFELEHAQELHRTQGKKVFYIKFGNLGTNITPEVCQVLHSEIYLEWPKDPTELKKQIFFDKLVAAIRGEQLFCGTSCLSPTPSSRRMYVPYDDQTVQLMPMA